MTTARKPLATVVLALLAAVAVMALAGVSFAGNGHGKGGGGSADAQYSSGGKQYGHHKVTLCHKGHTIRVAPPAVKAHLKHGDHLGAC